MNGKDTIDEKNRCENITDVISLCGGGIPAIYYGTGILYGLHKANKLLEKDESGKLILAKHLLITSSSGGMVPLILLQCVLTNQLHINDYNWFENYIINTIDKLNTLLMAKMYGASYLKSIGVYSPYGKELVRISNEVINDILRNVLPKEFINSGPLVFSNTSCCQYRYNYVVDSANSESPVVSNDFTHLNDLNILTQLSELFTACCVPISFSYLIDGTLNDAALLIDNDILALDSYPNLKGIYYYSLNAYDKKTNAAYKEPGIFTLKTFNDRSRRIYNYRAIYNLRTYVCRRNNKNGNSDVKFNLIVFPNKFDPIRKYNNKIYNDLVPAIFLQNDFTTSLSFLGIFNGDERFITLFLLIGAFESMYINKIPYEDSDKLTSTLSNVYKEVLTNPYDIYFKRDPLSVISRLIPNIF
jgi:hypothetical protein